MGRARKRAIYKRVEETIGVCRHRVARLQTEPLSLCRSGGKGRRRMRLPRTTLIRGPTFREPSWVRGVAWSILGGSGPLDSGSNPDGPTYNPVRNLYLFPRRFSPHGS